MMEGPDNSDAPQYDTSYLEARKKAEEAALGVCVNYQTSEMQDRGIILMCDLGVCIEGDEQLRAITSGTKEHLVEAFRLLLDEAYPEREQPEL